jgi:hypothetical protein
MLLINATLILKDVTPAEYTVHVIIVFSVSIVIYVVGSVFVTLVPTIHLIEFANSGGIEV